MEDITKQAMYNLLVQRRRDIKGSGYDYEEKLLELIDDLLEIFN